MLLAHYNLLTVVDVNAPLCWLLHLNALHVIPCAVVSCTSSDVADACSLVCLLGCLQSIHGCVNLLLELSVVENSLCCVDSSKNQLTRSQAAFMPKIVINLLICFCSFI